MQHTKWPLSAYASVTVNINLKSRFHLLYFLARSLNFRLLLSVIRKWFIVVV